MKKTTMAHKATHTTPYFFIFLFVFLSLSVLTFFGKLELYIIENEIIEISEVLFGSPITSTYQGKQLMPNNNQTAYFVSNHTVKTTNKNYRNQKTTPQYQYSYSFKPTNYSIQFSIQPVFIQNTSFEQQFNNRKRNNKEYANVFEYPDLKFLVNSPFQLGIASSQIDDNEFFETLFETSNNEPFRITYTDPDPVEPEGNPLPLRDDLVVLFIISAIYTLMKLLKNTLLK